MAWSFTIRKAYLIDEIDFAVTNRSLLYRCLRLKHLTHYGAAVLVTLPIPSSLCQQGLSLSNQGSRSK